MTTEKLVVCDPDCPLECEDKSEQLIAVRHCGDFKTKNCEKGVCCVEEAKVCVPATPEQVASARLRGKL